MKVNISRAELVKLIGKIQSIIPAKPTLPILANVLVEAYDNQLIITATDLVVSMRTQMGATISEEGGITLPARRFFQLIREINTSQIEIECLLGDIALIRAGSSEFRLNGIHKSVYPALPDLSHAEHFKISGPVLKEMLTNSVFAAAREDSRQIFNGVLMQVHNSQVTFTGADGKRIAKIYAEIETKFEHKHNYLIPIKGIEEIIKLIEDEEFTISLNPDKIALQSDSTILITQLLTGDYPEVDKIIPTHPEITVSLHREELMALLKQVSLFLPEKGNSIRFIFTAGELMLEASSSEIGEGKVSMPIDYSGSPLEIAFNPYFFYDMLRHSKDETIFFSLTNSHLPGLMKDSSTALYVIMPMRLKSIE